jgi:hypothetical protein
MLREIDLAFKFEHPVLENANPSDERALISFELGGALPVRFRKAVKRFEDFGLRVANRFFQIVIVVVNLATEHLDLLIDLFVERFQIRFCGGFVSVFHRLFPFVILRRKKAARRH